VQSTEFVTHVTEGRIDRVTIFRPSPDAAWSIYGYGETLPEATVNHIVLNEQGSKRLWSDLTAAYQFVRRAGYRQMIEVDG
jgi:hypothetical protein